jgi:hypothetical protein
MTAFTPRYEILCVFLSKSLSPRSPQSAQRTPDGSAGSAFSAVKGSWRAFDRFRCFLSRSGEALSPSGAVTISAFVR